MRLFMFDQLSGRELSFFSNPVEEVSKEHL